MLGLLCLLSQEAYSFDQCAVLQYTETLDYMFSEKLHFAESQSVVNFPKALSDKKVHKTFEFLWYSLSTEL